MKHLVKIISKSLIILSLLIFALSCSKQGKYTRTIVNFYNEVTDYDAKKLIRKNNKWKFKQKQDLKFTLDIPNSFIEIKNKDLIKQYKLFHVPGKKTILGINVIDKKLNGTKSLVKFYRFKTGDYMNVKQKILPDITLEHFLKNDIAFSKANKEKLVKSIRYDFSRYGNTISVMISRDLLYKAVDNRQIIDKVLNNRKYEKIILGWDMAYMNFKFLYPEPYKG